MRELCNIHNNYDFLHLKNSNKHITHYTDLYGLQGILNNKCIRLSDMYQQNDKSEGYYILTLLMKHIDDICSNKKLNISLLKECNKILPELTAGNYNGEHRGFIASFSTNSDSLTLWNYYTKNENRCGYNITFDTSILFSPKLYKVKKQKFDSFGNICSYWDSPPLKYGNVIYQKKTQINVLQHIIDTYMNLALQYNMKTQFDYNWLAPFIIDTILYNGYFFKNPCFKHEEEYRIVLTAAKTNLNSANNNTFMECTGYRKNYIELYYPADSIKYITNSPTNSDIDNKTAKNYLFINEFPNLQTIKNSKIPFRVL